MAPLSPSMDFCTPPHEICIMYIVWSNYLIPVQCRERNSIGGTPDRLMDLVPQFQKSLFSPGILCHRKFPPGPLQKHFLNKSPAGQLCKQIQRPEVLQGFQKNFMTDGVVGSAVRGWVNHKGISGGIEFAAGGILFRIDQSPGEGFKLEIVAPMQKTIHTVFPKQDPQDPVPGGGKMNETVGGLPDRGTAVIGPAF